MKKLKFNALSSTVSMLMILGVCQTTQVHASDVEIYKAATIGTTSILLMLDTSGSMGISSLVLPKNNKYGSPGDVDVSLCDQVAVSEHHSNRNNKSNIYEWAYNLRNTAGNTAIRKSVTIGSETVPYYVRGCIKNGVTQYDRLSRLKDAILPLLASDELKNTVKMGLGHFSSKTELTIGTATNRLTDGHSGRILVPNAPLSIQQRLKIAKEIASIKSLDTTTNEDGTANADLKLSSNNYPNISKSASGTPTAHAYAEAGAYMMGTGTGAGGENSGRVETIYDGYMVMQNGTEQTYFICVEVGTSTTTALGATVQQCINNWPEHSGTAVSQATIDRGVYRANGTRVNSLADFESEVPSMTTGWQTFTQFPEGWRYGGWMKVKHEPLDIEPIVGTVWSGYAGGTIGIVSYRTNPFAIKLGEVGTRKWFLDSCPAGSNALSNWYPLCVTNGTWERSATQTEKNQGKCLSPAKSGDLSPLPNARNANGGWHNEFYNLNNTRMTGSGDKRKCVQTNSAVNRPWGDVPVLGLVENNIGGMAYSATDTKSSDSTYIAGGSTQSCDGNGIYFLTDGAPNSTKDEMARTIMNHTLTSAYQFGVVKPAGAGVLASPALASGLFAGETGGWEYIGEYAKKLRNYKTDLDTTQKNQLDMVIKTAVVGFGSSFEGIAKKQDGTYDCMTAPNADARNACLWGSKNYGDGGFYYAQNSEDIKQSIIKFVGDVAQDIPATVTGAPTLPQDALNPLAVQPYGYYASIQPKPQEPYRLWLGDLNKYHVYNGELYNDSKTKRLLSATGEINSIDGVWPNKGMNGQLDVGLFTAQNGTQTFNRKIFTNRTVTGSGGTYTARADSKLNSVNMTTLFSEGNGENGLPLGTFKYDPDKNYWLNLLGYNIAPTTNNVTLQNLADAPVLRQLGAVLHSKPILLTQEGKINVNADGSLDTSKRDDYLLFGSTQGLLHVVDADDGKEVFAFAPHEMMVNQKEAFLAENATTGGVKNLFYGIDAPWVAHTQYISKADGTLTVRDSNRTVIVDDKDTALKGLQWVYGGLRMGGRSYYAIDLSDIKKPELKFHIDPDNAAAQSALSYMGQSWSKPTIAYVNWEGTKRLVMFVGGGYDASVNACDYMMGYECPTYNQTNKVGAGVYMFDANDGDLLWWSSANASTGNHKGAEASTKNDDLKYSVVSQINAIDRDADGLADHLYFGDLGGQVFRVDMNNATSNKQNFVQRVTKLYSENVATGLSPRFYEMPSITIHTGVDGPYAAVALSSGNRSSPLVEGNKSASDAVFVIYDNDVARHDLYASNFTSKLPVGGALADWNSNGIAQQTSGKYNLGWKHSYAQNAGHFKAMNDVYAMDNMLYVSVFDRNGKGIGGGCGSGVAGDTYLYQFCLPTGKCSFDLQERNKPNRVKLGAGILGSGVGLGFDNQHLGLIVNKDSTDKCLLPANKNLPECQLFSNTPKLQHLRWYEAK